VEERRVALIGCGAIGTVIARSIDNGTASARIVAAMDKVPEAADKLASGLRSEVRKCGSIDELMESGPNLIVEAANQDAVREYGERILDAGVDMIVMSTGAVLDGGLRVSLIKAAKRTGARIYLPSGAVGGLDAIGALRIAGIDTVTLTVSKPPEGLSGYLKEKGIDPSSITGARTLFEGDVGTAVKLFPANVNVAATLALASQADVKVRVVADASLKVNVHEIEVVSSASTIKLRFENVPHPQNPKTSYLAGLAAIRLIQRIAGEELQIGT
jgi:aspartate dehydrogenase